MKEITGIIDHRILLNYRIDPDVMQPQIPPEFKPKLVHGNAIGGIYQVSLSGMRPKGLPAIVGTRSHNAAHRIAVSSSKGEGVFVPRRDTNSLLNTLSGGRVFPGVYKKAKFEITIDGDHYNVRIRGDNAKPLMVIDGTVTNEMDKDSIFGSVDEVSNFFEGGNIGWSSRASQDGFDAIELKTIDWRMEPMEVHQEFSAFFSDETKFPKGTVKFDSAMIMRNLKHSWISKVNMCDICC